MVFKCGEYNNILQNPTISITIFVIESCRAPVADKVIEMSVHLG